MTVYRSSARLTISDLVIEDDGTNYLFKLSGTTLFAISKTQKNLLVIGEVYDDQSL